MFAQQRPGVAQLASGTVDADGHAFVDCRGMWFPLTISLQSTLAGKAVEFRNDPTAEWVAVSPDSKTAGSLSAAFLASVAWLRLTGNPGDVWSMA